MRPQHVRMAPLATHTAPMRICMETARPSTTFSGPRPYSQGDATHMRKLWANRRDAPATSDHGGTILGVCPVNCTLHKQGYLQGTPKELWQAVGRGIQTQLPVHSHWGKRNRVAPHTCPSLALTPAGEALGAATPFSVSPRY